MKRAPLQLPCKIELRAVKYAAFASEETACFRATIYIDGAKAGEAENDGHGGCTMIHPPALRERISAIAKDLPPVVTDWDDPIDPTKKFTFEPSAESIIDDLFNDWQALADLKRLTSRCILFTKADKPGVYKSGRAKSAIQLNAWLASERLPLSLGADKILNLMPIAEALAIYREKA